MASPYILFPAILVPVLIINTKCHTANNNSDVIVTYSGHGEAIDHNPEPKTIQTTDNIKIMIPESIIKMTTEAEVDNKEDVIFVPNERLVDRNYEPVDKFKMGNILYKKSVGDILSGQNVRIETEAPNQDIVFISGKNNENEETKVERKTQEKTPYKDTRRTKISFNCTNLDCNSTSKSVCGAKKDNGQIKYRLFFNDCYYRKVNCNFKYEDNRYKKVEIERCRNIGAHNSGKVSSFKPMPLPPPKLNVKGNFRRSSSSRRSSSMGIDGNFCTHLCPVSCPDDYEPECAVSGSGQRRVFVNHCKMDFNSCFFNVVWHRRPLAECVGGKKSDMRQNRGFINWMQRVGIVDKKGRLVLA